MRLACLLLFACCLFAAPAPPCDEALEHERSLRKALERIVVEQSRENRTADGRIELGERIAEWGAPLILGAVTWLAKRKPASD